MRYLFGLGIGVILLASKVSAAGENARKVIIAVFDVEVREGVLPAETVTALNNLLPALMVENGWLVVPREQMRERLTQIKKESYRSCYDEKCQIELGRELAAQKALSSRIEKVGGSCQIYLQLLDLKKALLEKAANASAACNEKELFEGLRKAAAKLGRGQSAGVAANAPATLKVDSRPAGAEVYLGREKIGKTPLEHVTAPGSKRLTFLNRGYEPVQQRISLQPGQTKTVSVEMEESFSYNTWGHVTFWSGVGLAALGALAAAKANSLGDEYKSGNYESYDASIRWTGAMYGLFGAATTLMVTGVVMWLLDREITIDDLPLAGAADRPLGTTYSFQAGGF